MRGTKCTTVLRQYVLQYYCSTYPRSSTRSRTRTRTSKKEYRLRGAILAIRQRLAGSCSFSCSCSYAVVCAERLRSRFARRPPKAAPRPPAFFSCNFVPRRYSAARCWQNPAAGCGNPILSADTPPLAGRFFCCPAFTGDYCIHQKASLFPLHSLGTVMREAILTPAGSERPVFHPA